MDTNIITLKAKTNQEAFDMVARHLHGMPARAMSDSGGSCVYESEDDKRKCAVGALLDLNSPRKHAWAKAIRSSITDLTCGRPDTAKRRAAEAAVDPFCVMPGDVSVALLQDLQRIHDDSGLWGSEGFRPRGWDRMSALATDFGLNTKALDALGV
jgi:hypothetical protein